jgi:hypothetical protein
LDPERPDPDSSRLAEIIASLFRIPLYPVRLFLAWFRSHWTQPHDSQRRRGFRILVAILVGVGALIEWRDLYVPAIDKPALVDLLNGHCWVTYDPTSWDPFSGIEASPATIHTDLRRIREAGFTGIVTFGSKGSLSLIPRIAKSEHLAIIMGVWYPRDVGELRQAIAQHSFVDAYCVGHDGLDKAGGYTIDELSKAILLLKRRTRRPVSTTEEVRRYKDPRLLTMGDWLFPDIHVSLLERASVDLGKAISATAAAAGRPLMFKMVTFPWQGAEGASLETQAQFYEHFMETIRDPEQPFAVRPSLVYHSAFDESWKIGYPFYEWDPYAGILNQDGRPRPAARAIISRCP